MAHGWTLLPHPLFIAQLDKLARAAEQESAPPAAPGPNRKLLAHVQDLMFNVIPQAPDAPRHRHGGALAGGHREWFRGKTGNGQYRLFYRFDTRVRIIVYAWLNDEQSLRTYGSATDAYAVFARMLTSGNPPTDWDDLLAEAKHQASKMPKHFRPPSRC